MTAPPSRTSPLWPLVVLTLGLAIVAAGCVYGIPPERLDHGIDKITSGVSWMIANPAGVAAAIFSALTAVMTVLTLLHITPPAWLSRLLSMFSKGGSSSSGSSTSGFVTAGMLATISTFAVAGLFIAAAAALLSGCGASAIRTHAIAAGTWHDALEAADVAITTTTSAELAQCPHDDGDARMACVDRIERLATAAAAARDVLVAPSNAYRAATLGACGVSIDLPSPAIPESCPDPGPDAMALLARFLASLMHDSPVLVAALRALGAAIPEGL